MLVFVIQKDELRGGGGANLLDLIVSLYLGKFSNPTPYTMLSVFPRNLLDPISLSENEREREREGKTSKHKTRRLELSL